MSVTAQEENDDIDLTGASPDIQLLEKRRRLDIANSRFVKQYEKYLSDIKNHELECKRLDDDREAFEHSLVKLKRFTKENDFKEKRAVQKIDEEKIVIIDLKKELNLLHTKKESILREIETVKAEINCKIMFHEFLENVKQVRSKEFKNIDDILSRHTTLHKILVELQENTKSNLNMIDQLSNKSKSLISDSSCQIAVLNSTKESLINTINGKKNRHVKEHGKLKKKQEDLDAVILKGGKISGVIKLLLENSINRFHPPLSSGMKKTENTFSELTVQNLRLIEKQLQDLLTSKEELSKN